MDRNEFETWVLNRIHEVGIREHACLKENNHAYYRFILKNGEEHYFKDLSNDQLQYLGLRIESDK